MKVPVLTDRGTFIHNGNEIGVIRQARLLPGVYTRRQANGHLEAQFNARVGTGKGFRVGLEPQTAQYRLKIAQSNLHLYSLLKDLGTTDEELARSWGQDILEMNKKKYDPRALDRAYERLVQKYKQEPKADREMKAKAVREALEEIQVSDRVMKKNLPNWMDRVKSAAWRISGEQREILDGFLEAPMEKRADFSDRELAQIVQFLNDNHQANIPLQAGKSEKEQAILEFTSGNSTFNPALAQLGQEGLQKVQSTPFLPFEETE